MYMLDIVQRKEKEMIILEVQTYTKENLQEYIELFDDEELELSLVGEISDLVLKFDIEGLEIYYML